MADYERRLQRLEDDLATADDRDDTLLEACQKRHAELMASPEMLAYMRDNPESETQDEEWVVKWAAIQDEILASKLPHPEGWKAELDAFLAAAKSKLGQRSRSTVTRPDRPCSPD